MIYLTKGELCDFYGVELAGLSDALEEEKKLGTIYYNERLFGKLEEENHLAIVLPMMGDIFSKDTAGRLPLLPFPVPRLVYESLRADRDYLLLTLARYKLSHLRGDFSLDYPFGDREYQQSLETVFNDYNYLSPYQGKILYWIDLRQELCDLLGSLPLEAIDDIVAHGRRIRVLKRVLESGLF